MKPQRLEELIIAWEEQTLSAEELAEFKHLLGTESQARRRLVEASVFQSIAKSRMRAWKTLKVGGQIQSVAAARKPSDVGWLSWRLLAAAAAAGIVLGMFCTSMVFAYVAPSLGKVITLLQDSFENGPAPLLTGIPVEPGRWSGDFTEIVCEEQGVKPAGGRQMLRFLRADYEGKPNPENSGIADIYRLIDVRLYRQEFMDNAAVVQLSAAFNTFEFPAGEAYEYKMSLYALDAQTATNGSLRIGNTLNEHNLAVASTGRIRLDRNPATWQRAVGDLRIPAETDFLLIHIEVRRPPNLPSKPTYAGHYLDDVRLTMRRSPLE